MAALLVLVLCLPLCTACFPDPSVDDPLSGLAVAAVLTAPRGECLFAGRSGSVANSGILGCAPLNSAQCGSSLYFKTATERNAFASSISTIGSSISSCLTPASNALTRINSLSLPGFLYMNQAGGTVGPHSTGSFTATMVDSCAGIGLGSSFIGSAGRVLSNSEITFLTTAKGLVALEDGAGTCRTDMGLTTAENTAAQNVISGSAARFATCDYGVDDATKADCPADLQKSEYMFSGIGAW